PPPSTEPAPVPPPSTEPAPVPPREAGEVLNLNQATYDDLRRLTLSVTQTGRVLDYRETLGGFKSLDQLDDIAGLPRDLLTELKRKLTI
ncbi:MAG: ComEA family DNA-binding protein, partial [Nocardioidaceae bacterium]